MAIALNELLSEHIHISLVDINKSDLSFKPDKENNQILFGLKALNGLNDETFQKIIAGRPYSSFEDFLARCPLNKTQMISLIKGGAFDLLVKEKAEKLHIPSRYLVMGEYLYKTGELKKGLNLQNLSGLLQANLIPDTLATEKTVFQLTKVLKKNCSWKDYYVFNQELSDFYIKAELNPELLEVISSVTCIKQKAWDKIYQSFMDKMRQYIKDNQVELLKQYNRKILNESWNKYAKGTISAWEMESLCFYFSGHELANVNMGKYGLSDFFDLPEEPEVEKCFMTKGRHIPIYKLTRIAGTVIAKDDTRSSVYLLTTSGVTTVKFSKEYYAMYSRRISEQQANGTKKVMEEGWFKRGTKLVCTGFRREDTFVVKTYKATASHQLYIIDEIKSDGNLTLRHDRYQPTA